MRILAAFTVIAFTLAGSVAANAGDRAKPRKPSSERTDSQRSSTVDHRGLCQRDTGRPVHTLNLNHFCDREEFWARFNQGDRNSR